MGADISPWLVQLLAPSEFSIAAGGYEISSMDSTVDEVRHANLLRLLEQYPTIQAFADAIDRPHSQVSQLKNRNRHSTTGAPRAIGGDIARHIEKCLNLDPGWMDTQHLAEGDVRPTGASAHLVSQPPYSSSPLITWGAILSNTLPPVFRIAVPDDSMAPQVRAGQIVEFTTGVGPRPGDGVLVSDASGALYFRVYRTRRADEWEAHPLNEAYRPLDAERDGLTVLAVRGAAAVCRRTCREGAQRPRDQHRARRRPVHQGHDEEARKLRAHACHHDRRQGHLLRVQSPQLLERCQAGRLCHQRHGQHR